MTRTVYRFYAELCDYSPKIWRRFQTANDVTMAYLGYVLMTMFEMHAGHLFAFDIPHAENFDRALRKHVSVELPPMEDEGARGDWRIALPLPDEWNFSSPLTESERPEEFDAAEIKLRNALFDEGDLATFTYDFGDDWQIALRVEEIIRNSSIPATDLPKVLDGEGYGIIENCGGAYGLKKLAAAFKRKRGPQYEEFREWLGVDSLDMTAFDIADMNYRLKKVPAIYRKIYENHQAPSRRSIAILTREYLKK